ncbi:MAG: hypothetical protein V3U02_00335 [Calditrichia bacterium]
MREWIVNCTVEDANEYIKLDQYPGFKNKNIGEPSNDLAKNSGLVGLYGERINPPTLTGKPK